MPSKSQPASDPRIDAYIEGASAFAQPILKELRARVHTICPAVVETIKWRAPSFEHGGFLGGMAAFKNYCSFMFWQEKALSAEAPEVKAVIEQCAKMTTLKDLPTKTAFRRALTLAMARNAAGLKKRVPKNTPKKLTIPKEFAAALAKDRTAKQHFDGFARGYQRDYIEWVSEAKHEATRDQRIEQSVTWLREGKHRNWKYEKC